VDAHVIAYGGDHAVGVKPVSVDKLGLPDVYAFSVCRIEPENNVHMVIEAFSKQTVLPLVIVGNWNSSEYGKNLCQQYAEVGHIYLLDPIYDLGKLYTLRSQAKVYVHGHSAGGTNPSLVEAMHFGKPILAFDCDFNRFTTKDKAFYFASAEQLGGFIASLEDSYWSEVGFNMKEIAKRRYTWGIVAQQYFSLL